MYTIYVDKLTSTKRRSIGLTPEQFEAFREMILDYRESFEEELDDDMLNMMIKLYYLIDG